MTSYIEKYDLPIVVVPDDAYDKLMHAIHHRQEEIDTICAHVSGPYNEMALMIFRGVIIRPRTEDDRIKAATAATLPDLEKDDDQ